MSITFNADEVFEIAEQIERNGAKFYRRAAQAFAGSDAHKLLADLANWEEGHERLFAEMRRDLSQSEKEPVFFDPDNEAVMYLRAMADGHVFSPKKDLSKILTGNEGLVEILQKAIRFEKDSIAFYLGMRDLVSEELGKDKVARIIEEEKSHVVMLNDQIALGESCVKN